MSKFNEIAERVCKIGGLDLDKFLQFATEDKHTGYGTDHRWPGMSISADEGKVLYALVRMLRPLLPLEIGVWNGCSTVHILAALAQNQAGFLMSWDIEGSIVPMVPLALHTRWLPDVADALTRRLPISCDFVFEDGPHTLDFTRDFVRRILQQKCPPMVLVSHDCLYPDWGHSILDAWRAAGLEPQVVDTGRGMCFHFWSRDDET